MWIYVNWTLGQHKNNVEIATIMLICVFTPLGQTGRDKKKHYCLMVCLAICLYLTKQGEGVILFYEFAFFFVKDGSLFTSLEQQ